MQSPVNDSTLEELVATFGAELGALVRRTSARLLLEAQQQATEAIDQLHPDRWGEFPEGVGSTPQQDTPLRVWVCDDADLLMAVREAVRAGGRTQQRWDLHPDLVEAIATAVYQAARPRMAELEGRAPEAERSATDKRNEYLLVELGRLARRWVELPACHDGHTVYAKERAGAGRDVLAVLAGQGVDVAADLEARRGSIAGAARETQTAEGPALTGVHISALQNRDQLAAEVARLRSLGEGPVWLVPVLRRDAKAMAGNHGRGRTPWPSTFPGRLMDSLRAVLGWPEPWDGPPATELWELELEGREP